MGENSESDFDNFNESVNTFPALDSGEMRYDISEINFFTEVDTVIHIKNPSVKVSHSSEGGSMFRIDGGKSETISAFEYNIREFRLIGNYNILFGSPGELFPMHESDSYVPIRSEFYEKMSAAKLIQRMARIYLRRKLLLKPIIIVQSLFRGVLAKRKLRALRNIEIDQIKSMAKETKEIQEKFPLVSKTPEFKLLCKNNSICFCISCQEDKLPKEMINSIVCCSSSCIPSYCWTCWRKLLFKLGKEGLHKFSSSQLKCFSCMNVIELENEVEIRRHLPSIDFMFLSYLKSVLSFDTSLSFYLNQEEQLNVLLNNASEIYFRPFSYKFEVDSRGRLSKTGQWKDGIILPPLFLEWCKKTGNLLHFNCFSFAINNKAETFGFSSLSIYNVGSNVKITKEMRDAQVQVFEKKILIEATLHDGENLLRVGKVAIDLSAIGILNMIGLYDFRNCQTCNKMEIVGKKATACEATLEDDASSSLYKCIKCNKKGDIKTCPCCSAYCQRQEGCNFMTCPVCDQYWCYHCDQFLVRGKKAESDHYARSSFDRCKGILDAKSLIALEINEAFERDDQEDDDDDNISLSSTTDDGHELELARRERERERAREREREMERHSTLYRLRALDPRARVLLSQNINNTSHEGVPRAFTNAYSLRSRMRTGSEDAETEEPERVNSAIRITEDIRIDLGNFSFGDPVPGWIHLPPPPRHHNEAFDDIVRRREERRVRARDMIRQAEIERDRLVDAHGVSNNNVVE